MTASLRIAEVADRVGISTATVRYYETIGVLPEPERAGNGYRVYDQRTVEQLEFIARAKQLGCSLDEIGDLVTAWNGGECGPVQDRLRTLVADKLTAARGEIVELEILTQELQRAATTLEQHRPVGPCDDTCGCVTTLTSADANSTQASIPIALTAPPNLMAAAGDVPIACTLASDQIPDRLDDWGSLLHGATRLPIDGGVRVELDEHIEVSEVARLAAAEQGCCRFFSFRLTIDERGAGLEITAPPDALDIVHAAFGAPQ
ncbi:MerR family transcriptional regulator [Ilumatobacter nonamiensis]|uniref:MerR family transcriptional regulator n=1 Tax=Ilumatobacter nonamiensis TaxID=467093 RepID=UPI0003481D0D|nr:MerR family transcriptional regulator [Ilumatobacter nonamiensis]